METTVLNNYKKAAAIWKSAINFAQKKAKENVLLFDLAESIESRINEEGAQAAFPVNLSKNEEAAHFTPKWNDAAILKETDLLKIDVGVSVEGYICDGAITVNLDNAHAKQIEANELALENAITKANFGKPVERIGAEIERTLKEKGFNPVYNLGGHGLGKNDIHSPPSIPNHAGGDEDPLEEGAIAIEPFASTGAGNVGEVQQVEIFAETQKKTVRNNYARAILKAIEKYEGKPFAERWLRKDVQEGLNSKEKNIQDTKNNPKLSEFQITFGLKELMKTGCLQTFAGLREAKGAMVTQVEKSVLVLENETIVLGE